MGPRNITCYAIKNFMTPLPSRHNKSTGIRILNTPYNSTYMYEQFGKKTPLLFVDFEGNFAPKNEFTEMALIFKYGDFIDTFQSFVRPSVPPNRLAFIKTGIGRETTDNAPNFETVYENIIDWLSRLQQIQNFDWKTLLPISFDTWDFKEWISHLVERDMPLPIWMLHWCDIRKLIAKKFTNNDFYKLSLLRAAEICNIQFDASLHHTAMNDALVCLQLGKHVYIKPTDMYHIARPYGIRCF